MLEEKKLATFIIEVSKMTFLAQPNANSSHELNGYIYLFGFVTTTRVDKLSIRYVISIKLVI